MNHTRNDIPWQGEHTRATHYRDGAVADGTHDRPTITFTGTVKATVRDGVSWIAITTDRPLTADEGRTLAAAGARTMTVRDTTNVIVPAAALDAWAFEVLSAPALHLVPADPASMVQGRTRIGARLRREVSA